MTYLAFGMPGTDEMMAIAGALVFLFGAKKLPQLAKGVGQSILELKRGLREVEADENKYLEGAEEDKP